MDNLITKYLNYKKSRLVSYALCMYRDKSYQDYEIECLKKYINNYVEVFYHHEFETFEKDIKIDKKVLETEQEGMRLELLDKLSTREILESNASYTIKKGIANTTKEYVKVVIEFDQQKITEENVEEVITKIITKASMKVPILQTAPQTWLKEWKETAKIEKKVLQEKQNFVLNQVPYSENLWEITLLTRVKQINQYKPNLVKRVEQEEKIEIEKITLELILLNQIILGQLIRKETYGNYIIYIPEELWTKKEITEEFFQLLDDKILKNHIFLGITYNVLTNSKRLIDMKNAGYQFVCYQDFTHILDIPTKIATIDTSKLFNYLVVTKYKAKDKLTIEKEEPSIMKQILFSKED